MKNFLHNKHVRRIHVISTGIVITVVAVGFFALGQTSHTSTYKSPTETLKLSDNTSHQESNTTGSSTASTTPTTVATTPVTNTPAPATSDSSESAPIGPTTGTITYEDATSGPTLISDIECYTMYDGPIPQEYSIWSIVLYSDNTRPEVTNITGSSISMTTTVPVNVNQCTDNDPYND